MQQFPARHDASFILRFWWYGEADGKGRVEWRASLEDARSGEKHYFGTAAALLRLLRDLGFTDPPPPAAGFWRRLRRPAAD